MHRAVVAAVVAPVSHKRARPTRRDQRQSLAGNSAARLGGGHLSSQHLSDLRLFTRQAEHVINRNVSVQ
jgi:hypothetical protein